MRKLLPLLIAAAGLSPAATILCTPSNQNTITNVAVTSPQEVDCGVVNAAAGFEITGISLKMLGSFNDAIQGTNHQLRFVATNDFNAATVTADTAIDDFAASSGQITGAVVAVGNLTTLGNVKISVTTATLGGLALPANASFTAYLETSETRIQTGVPEPSSLALLGSALVGLGWVARRRK